MIALRGEIAALSKQVERLSRDRSRNSSRRRYGKSPYRSKTPSRREDYNLTMNFVIITTNLAQKLKNAGSPVLLQRLRKTNHCYRRQYFGSRRFDSHTTWPSPYF
ncbi:hypothetical protein NPIL_122481 [Nephila pilipes]|uniref:Uncharacterized protein n=1 Tax=Nephila pilipes TaxID=299642 RepID=A0A8X6P5N7_NEPPI|nr:hypothetical protein NPIL_122481 [Nephila pilipes]